jgi:hypothetical protein
MPARVRFTVDVHEQNAPRRFQLYDWKVIRPQLDPAITITETFLSKKAAIDADPHLTAKGKDAARVKAGKEALEALSKWHAPRLAGLDADLGTQRAALVPTGDKPTDRQIDFLLSHLRDRTPQEIAVLYNSATDERRLLMEAASASVGDIPFKAEDGGVAWRPLLDPEAVNESVMARAAVKNPQGVARLNELADIRALHVTIAGHAVAEVREALSGLNPDA